MFSSACQLRLNSAQLTGDHNVDGMRLICQFGLLRRPMIETETIQPTGHPKDKENRVCVDGPVNGRFSNK